jgi:hypothetical protein
MYERAGVTRRRVDAVLMRGVRARSANAMGPVDAKCASKLRNCLPPSPAEPRRSPTGEVDLLLDPTTCLVYPGAANLSEEVAELVTVVPESC